MVGNKPNYNTFDILRCFIRLNSPTSRSTLAKELGLGEGTVRTILEILKAKNLLESSKKGHVVSQSGRLLFENMTNALKEYKRVSFNSIYPEFRKFAILADAKLKLKNTYRLRDMAVKLGAEGAIILVFDGRLHTPEPDRQDYSELKNLFTLNNGNILILTFADSYREAENGAFAIAAELIDELKRLDS